MKQEKCLVTEAMDKCQCELCKTNRKFRDFSIRIALEQEAQRIYVDAMKSAGIGVPSKKLTKQDKR